jgi:hypothetical protein
MPEENVDDGLDLVTKQLETKVTAQLGRQIAANHELGNIER